jgi:hypothetical protein
MSMAELIPASLHGRIRAIMFNLGYLPGGIRYFFFQGPDGESVELFQFARGGLSFP